MPYELILLAFALALGTFITALLVHPLMSLAAYLQEGR